MSRRACLDEGRIELRCVWSAAFGACLLALLMVSVSLLPHLGSSAEFVRMRNALLLDPAPAVHDWSPARVPPGFAVDSAVPSDHHYAELVRAHRLVIDNDDWATALAIARHLLAGGRLSSSPIQSDLAQTYLRITRDGEGYCGDYADTFTGIAHAAGLFTRPWAFSFDGFGGRGHIYNEVWDRKAGRWIAIDVFNNMYFEDERGHAMSAADLRHGLRTGQEIAVKRIRNDVPPGFKADAKALDYYRRGLPQGYMWWGTNVFEYDQSALVRFSAHFGRAVEQLGGIAAGVHPRIRILHDVENEAERAAMRSLRWRLLALVVLLPACAVLLTLWLTWNRPYSLPGRCQAS